MLFGAVMSVSLIRHYTNVKEDDSECIIWPLALSFFEESTCCRCLVRAKASSVNFTELALENFRKPCNCLPQD